MKKDVYDELAASGRYLNTGKVLIGLCHVPVQRRVMSRDEERIQAGLLGHRLARPEWDAVVGVSCVLAVIMVFWALGMFFV